MVWTVLSTLFIVSLLSRTQEYSPVIPRSGRRGEYARELCHANAGIFFFFFFFFSAFFEGQTFSRSFRWAEMQPWRAHLYGFRLVVFI
ncbi:uncharacterized protein EURHEDRAFT_317005 [Aspergillus ruber CBS 135680]|uniref:Secreted protein n=1 Tax=Aspergillus ruber (strain CBS 135680) TaxID=1388766 RepID=A0A017S0M9_ASPRC|nr:uncharacterized protein EURHEDRAFT_317005 [Aspergillus ruber CBS 135680]EYE90179.1 hypothetical protein EURHEDRAFT_317005 [Aspergillus ruber CBS 135680]